MANIPFLNNAYFAAKVGIGTASPSELLELKPGSGGDAKINILNSSGVQKALIGYDNGNGGLINLYNEAGARNVFVRGYGDSYFNGGNVGIGIINPSRKLHVHADSGNAYLQLTQAATGTTSNDGFQISMGAAQVNFINRENGNMVFETNNTEKMRITNTGDVGIGTTSPVEKLHVFEAGTAMIRVDSGATSPYKAGIEFLRSSINGGRIYNDGNAVQVKLESDFAYDAANPSRGGFMFKTAPVTSGTLVDAVRIDARGYVGIGINGTYTNAPQRLTVVSDDDIQPVAQFKNIGNGGGLFVRTDSTTRPLLELFSGSSYRFVFTGTGNLGIGTTSPGAKLDVVGEIRASEGSDYSSISTSGGDTIFANVSTAANNIRIFNGGSETMRITSSGNVGIGTTAPSQKLHISGNMRLTGAFRDRLNSQGAANYVLTSTGSNGTQWVDASGSSIIGGPYLPLSAGPSYPLTNNLYLKTTNDASIAREEIIWQTSQGTNRSFIRVGGSYANNDLEFGTGNSVLGMILHANAGLSIGTTVATTLPPASGLLVQGNVGIGTTSPQSGFKLDVLGNVITRGSAYVLNNLIHYGTSDFKIDASTGSTAIKFHTGGSERIRITSSGNVGIGTTSPGVKLDVNGQIRSNNEFLLQTGTTAIGSIRNQSGALDIRGDSSRDVSLGSVTSPQALFVEGTNGNVGIGTTSPGYKLHNTGTTRLEGRLTLGGNVNNFIEGTGSSLDFKSNGEYFFKKGANTQLTILSGGNVGIGVTTPNRLLHLLTTTTDETQQLLIQNGHSGDAAIMFNISGDTYSLGIDNSDGDKFKLSYGNLGTNDRIVIDSTGNVGIGTTSPSGILHVKGSTDNTTVYIDTNNNAIGDSAKISFNDRAQVGWIDAAVTLTDGGGNKDIKLKVGTGSVFVQTNNTTRLTVANGGNVGIGTTSPEVKLTIKGDALNTDQPVRITNSVTDTHTGLFLNNTGSTVGEKYGMQFGGYNQYSIGGIFGVLDSTSGSTSGDITFDMGNGTASGALVERMRITHEGNVGIGFPSPAVPLVVEGKIRSNDDNSADYLEIFCDGSGTGDSYIENTSNNIQIKSAYATSFSTSGSLAMFINHNQNVGIGTTSPTSKLEIDGGDIEVDDSASGLILKSPDGTRYRVTVANGGTLSVAAV